MNARGEYGKREPRLGRGLIDEAQFARRDGRVKAGAWYTPLTSQIPGSHSIDDHADAVRQMALDWEALYHNLASQAGSLTPDPTRPSGYHYTTQVELDANPPDPAKVAWWKSYADPLVKQWVKFRIEQLGGLYTTGDAYIAWTERATTSWDTYKNWKKKLDALRADAQKRGFTITASPTTDLPTTIWEDVECALKKGGKDVWTLVKYGAWAVLGIGAIVALSSAASKLRSGKDPAETYVKLVKRRSSRALPGSPRLALPPGEPVAEDA